MLSDDQDRLAADPDDLLGFGTWNVGTVHGGQGIPVVALMCSLGVDRRLMPGESAEQIAEEVRRRITETGIDCDGIDVAVTVDGDAGFVTDANHPLIDTARSAITAQDRAPSVGGWTAACDGGFISRPRHPGRRPRPRQHQHPGPSARRIGGRRRPAHRRQVYTPHGPAHAGLTRAQPIIARMSSALIVVPNSSPSSTTASNGAFAVLQRHHLQFLDGARRHQPVHVDGARLADRWARSTALRLGGRVPPRIAYEAVVGLGEVEPNPPARG